MKMLLLYCSLLRYNLECNLRKALDATRNWCHICSSHGLLMRMSKKRGTYGWYVENCWIYERFSSARSNETIEAYVA